MEVGKRESFCEGTLIATAVEINQVSTYPIWQIYHGFIIISQQLLHNMDKIVSWPSSSRHAGDNSCLKYGPKL